MPVLAPLRFIAPPPIVVRCDCGRFFTASEWARRPHRGIQEGSDGERLELRGCYCGSTLSTRYEPPERPMPLRMPRAGGPELELPGPPTDWLHNLTMLAIGIFLGVAVAGLLIAGGGR